MVFDLGHRQNTKFKGRNPLRARDALNQNCQFHASFCLSKALTTANDSTLKDTVRALLGAKASVDLACSDGATALMLACEVSRAGTVGLSCLESW